MEPCEDHKANYSFPFTEEYHVPPIQIGIHLSLEEPSINGLATLSSNRNKFLIFIWSACWYGYAQGFIWLPYQVVGNLEHLAAIIIEPAAKL